MNRTRPEDTRMQHAPYPNLSRRFLDAFRERAAGIDNGRLATWCNGALIVAGITNGTVHAWQVFAPLTEREAAATAAAMGAVGADLHPHDDEPAIN